MPAIAVQKAPPSTLVDVLGQVADAFQLMGDATPIEVGAQYLEAFGTGSAPRVLFVPEPNGKVDGMIEMGNPASMKHSCDVYVRGPETGGVRALELGGDLERFRATYELADRVIGCLAVAASGRLEWGNLADSSPTKTDAYGAELKFSFGYRRDIRHLDERWRLAAAAADTDPVVAVPPPGKPADGVQSVGLTVTPQE